jgi:hypothetical protein
MPNFRWSLHGEAGNGSSGLFLELREEIIQRFGERRGNALQSLDGWHGRAAARVDENPFSGHLRTRSVPRGNFQGFRGGQASFAEN